MQKEINYFYFLAVLILSFLLGLAFPDIDQMFQSLLGHRSILTHSILLPYLLYVYLEKKEPSPRGKTILIGLLLGIGLHLSADLHPKSWIGFALIKLPFNISIGELSPIWIGINAIAALYAAAYFLNLLTNRKLFWISYLVVALVVGLTYADAERYNEETIATTFIVLLFSTFFVAKIKSRKNLINDDKKIEKVKKKPLKKKKSRFWVYVIGIPLAFILLIIILGS